jgi:hypothetical protein
MGSQMGPCAKCKKLIIMRPVYPGRCSTSFGDECLECFTFDSEQGECRPNNDQGAEEG